MQKETPQKPTHKLSTKLFKATIIPIIIVLSLASILCIAKVFSSTNDLMKQQLQAESHSSCTQILSLVEQYLSLVSEEVTNNSLYQYLKKVTPKNQDDATAYYTDLRNTLDNIYEAEPDAIVSSWIVDFDTMSGFSDSYTDWKIETDDIDIDNQIWLKKAKTTRLPYITDIYIAPIQNIPIISIIVPILDNKYETCYGVLGVSIKLDYIKNVIFENQELSNISTVIIDGNNRILSHPEDKYLNTPISDFLHSDLKDLKKLDNDSKKQQLFSFSFEGEKYLSAITELPAFSWKIATIIPEKYAREQVIPLAQGIAFILIGSVVLLSIIMRTVSRRITVSLESLTTSAKELAKGNYSFHGTSTKQDEIGELSRAMEHSIHVLRHRALFDDLTQIYNKFALIERIQKLFKENPESKFAIIRFDIARFKLINDMFGEQKGDEILRYIASVLQDQVSPESAYGRLNNDVFCICRSYQTEEELIEFIEKFSLHIKAFPINFNLVPYFGICVTTPKTAPPIGILFGWSSLALNTIKGSSLINYAFFASDMRNHLLTEGKIEREMENALETNQFHVFLQPKVDIKTSKVVGAESLVRWIHPVDGFIRPDSFIPLFEKNGFIISLDEYVWKETCTILREWLDKGYPVVPISINVSRVHMFDPKFVSKLIELINIYQIPPHLLELEFTESAFIDDVNQLYSIMTQLQTNGFTLTMDDFGSGYSSLNMLKEGPIDVIKIDREFLNDTSTSDNGKIVIKNTISMLNQLHKGIVAEGVETLEQANFLLSAGCNIAQGYYYSKPISKSEFEKFAFHISDS